MTSPSTPTGSPIAGVDSAAIDDAADRWRAIISTAANDPAIQARVEAAANLADTAISAAARTGWARPRPGVDAPDVLDASAAWSRVALMWHQVLTDTETFTWARTSPQTTCRIDGEKLRTWLASADGALTVAATLRIDEHFDLYGFDKWNSITKLLDAAQQAGLYGVDGHRIEIVHQAGDRGYVNAHRVTLSTPQHGTLCSDQIDTLALLTEHLSGIDAAVHALTVIAEQTDELLTQRALLADATWPMPANTTSPESKPLAAVQDKPQENAKPRLTAAQAAAAVPARAFRPLAMGAEPAIPATPAAAPTRSRNGRGR